MTLTYAGVTLKVPTPEQQETIQAWMDSWTEFEFTGKTWPGNYLLNQTFAQHNWPIARPLLGTLYWPFTAMKWAVGHFVCSGEELALIRASLPTFDSQSPPQPAPLVMSTGDAFHTITTNLFLLPPRPIHQIAGGNQFYLLTLVDERYHWWYKDCGELQVINGTGWVDLYEAVGVAMNITINVGPINANYFFPDPSFSNYFQSGPIVLDSIAYNCGQRIIRGLDGQVFAVNNDVSLAALNANILNVNNQGAKILGGSFQRTNDFAYAMPAEVHNLTPVWKSSVPSVLFDTFHAEVNKLITQAGFNQVVGFAGQKTFRDTFHGTEASAFANEALLATQVALDYWARIWNAFLDVTLNQPLNVVQDGLHDFEWTYTCGRVSTRIKRPAWNWEPDLLLHGDGNGPFYGNSANEPWQIQPFFAQITSSPTGAAYPWKEVIPATGGTFIDKPLNQRTGTAALNPAYDINLSTSVAANTYVIMWRGFQNAAATKQEWLFTQIAGGSGTPLTVEDGSTTVTNVNTIDFTSGAVVSNLGGGIAGVAVSGSGATLLTSGFVNTTITDGTLTQLATVTLAASGKIVISGNMLGVNGVPGPLAVILSLHTVVAGSPVNPALSIQTTDPGNFGGFNDGSAASLSRIASLSSGTILGLYIVAVGNTAGVTTYTVSGDLSALLF